jgi:hypothetical protein
MSSVGAQQANLPRRIIKVRCRDYFRKLNSIPKLNPTPQYHCAHSRWGLDRHKFPCPHPVAVYEGGTIVKPYSCSESKHSIRLYSDRRSRQQQLPVFHVLSTRAHGVSSLRRARQYHFVCPPFSVEGSRCTCLRGCPHSHQKLYFGFPFTSRERG